MKGPKSIVLKYFPNADPDNHFLLVFRHNSQTSNWFTSENDFKFANSIYKYSILGYINDDFKVSDTFEFIMEYPEKGVYGHWTQKINPLEAEGEANVGLQERNSTWDKRVSFNGLHRSSKPNSCFLEGTNEMDINDSPRWYYSIGSKRSWNGNYIPAYYHGVDTFAFHEVLLWLKITNLQLLNRIPLYSTHHCQKFYFKTFYPCFLILFTL